MIQPTSLLPLSPSLPQGAARSPGGGAFALPRGEEPADDQALLADEDGNERQDDAASGNALPTVAATIDPWLVAAMAIPAAVPVVQAAPVAGPEKDRASTATTGAAVAPPVLAIDAAGVRAVASPPGAPAPTAPTPEVRALVDERTGLGDEIDRAPGKANGQAVALPKADPEAIATPPRHALDPAAAPERARSVPPAAIEHVTSGNSSAFSSATTPTARRLLAGQDTSAVSPRTGLRGAERQATDGATLPEHPTTERPAGERSWQPPAKAAEPADSLPTAMRATAAPTLPHSREVAEVAEVAHLVRRSAEPMFSPLPAASVTTARLTPAASKAREIDGGDAAPVAYDASPPAAVQLALSPTATTAVASPITGTATLPLGWRLRTPPVTTDAAAIVPSRAAVLPPLAAASSVTSQPVAPTYTADRPLPVIEPLTAGPVAPGSSPAPIDPARAMPSVTTLPPASSTGATIVPPPDQAPTVVAPDSGATATMAAPRVAQPLRCSPALATPVVAAAQPAAIVFGAARYAAQPDDRREEPNSVAGTIAGTALPMHAASAAPAAQAPLDVRHERWPAAMVERIEMIRDAAKEADTRIRLVPDALGAIDVDVRRDGDTLHVRFTAEQPQTRALLQDAAPRLADAAEARGLRLGQTTVGGDGGLAQQQQQPQGRHQPLPAAPARAHRPAAEAKPDADDTRLA